VKAPKVYVADSGLLHALLGIDTAEALESHPKVGASWEGFALDAAVQALGARPTECFHWATQGGAELDLLVVRGARRLGFEFKRHSAPTRTRSMVEAVATLGLERLDVVYPGTEIYPLGAKIRAVPVASVGWEASALL
jgi:predicted AAA+ superfamily ATPase